MTLRLLLTVALLGFGITSLRATGGFYDDEPAVSYLECYISTLPRKPFIDIEGLPTKAEKAPTTDEVLAEFSHGPSPQLVAKVDEFIARARIAESQAQELISDEYGENQKATPRSYIGYNQRAGRDHALLNALETLRDVATAVQGTQCPADELKAFAKARLDGGGVNNFETTIQETSPELKPAWKYLNGAFSFHNGDTAEAKETFQDLINDPHAKAFKESALFMKARCVRELNAGMEDPGDNAKPEGLQLIRDAFHDYLNQFPKGRYAADAWGWLGGLETDNIDALVDFYNEGSAGDHPETLASASNEMERIFSQIDYDHDNHDFDRLAAHPDLALFACYMGLGTSRLPGPSDVDGNPELSASQMEQASSKKKWRESFFGQLAPAVLAHKDLYVGVPAQAKYLAILAHAASDQGHQQNALDLVQMATKDGPLTDDLFFVKSLALQRMNRYVAAVECYKDMLGKFPASSLARGARYRMALALHELGKNGEALEQLASLEEGNKLPDTIEKHGYPYSGEFESDQISDTIDALSKFSPPETLLGPLSETDPKFKDFRTQLATIVSLRYLANDDFTSAAKWAPTPDLAKEYGEMADEVAQVDSSTLPANKRAETASKLGDVWAKNRGSLTNVSPVREDYGDRKFDFDNAAALNFSAEDCQVAADAREELNHARKCLHQVWQLDPQNAMAPHALWNYIRAERILIENGPGHGTQIDEQVVRGLYDTLTSQFPNSDEAKKYAVYWTFTAEPPSKDGERYLSKFSIKDVPYPNSVVGSGDDTKTPEPEFEDKRLDPWFKELFNAGADSEDDGPNTASDHNAADRRDEMAQSTEENHRPVQTDKSAPSPVDPNQDFTDSDKVLSGEMPAEDFLAKYPKSLRREEVLYHIIRNCLSKDKLDISATKKAFADYGKEFPDSHLKRGVLYMQAQFDEKQHNWGEAVNEYYEVATQKKAPELHLDAAAHLAFIFEELNQDDLRREILGGIQKYPKARHALREYATCDELPYLKDFILDQVKE